MCVYVCVRADDCIGSCVTQSCIPPLTPSSNQKLSQAILAIFHSFDMQQLHIPRGLQGAILCCLARNVGLTCTCMDIQPFGLAIFNRR